MRNLFTRAIGAARAGVGMVRAAKRALDVRDRAEADEVDELRLKFQALRNSLAEERCALCCGHRQEVAVLFGATDAGPWICDSCTDSAYDMLIKWREKRGDYKDYP